MATRFSFEVCILTYNRAELLRQALDALSAQTDGNFAVAVYDNASCDETPQTVESFRGKFGARLRYVRHGENIGADANFHSAVSGAKCDYTMFMHDDDLPNPRFVEYARAAIEKFGDVALLSSNYSEEEIYPDAAVQWEQPERRAYVFGDRRKFAAFVFCAGRALYSSAVYRTADLKKYNRPNIYGKIGDIPVLIDAAAGGKTVVLSDKNIYKYRIHAGQDSCTLANGIRREEIVNRIRLFRDVLTSGSLKYKFAYGICYAENYYKLLKCAGADDAAKRGFFKSLGHEDGAGAMAKIYAVPLVGAAMRGVLRFLFFSRAIIWVPRKF